MAKGFDQDQAEVVVLRAALAAAEVRADQAEAAVAIAVARTSDDAALIAHLRLQIAKLTRTVHGQRSERTQRLLEQYELQLQELEAFAAADAPMASAAAAKAGTTVPAARRHPSRQPFPAHLPRVRVVVPGPTA